MLSVGAYNKLPHYLIVGGPSRMYLWINEDGHGNNTSWITGREAFKLYHKLTAIKSNKLFISEIKKAYEEFYYGN